MNIFDIGILIVAALAALGGWRMGFLARFFSWLGLGAGLYLAVRYLPEVVKLTKVSGSLPRIILAIVVLLGGAFIGQAVGLMIGGRLHAVLPFGGVRTLDRAVGALVGVFGVFVALWLLVPSLAAVPGTLSQVTTGSVIARWVSNETLAYGITPPNPLQRLRQLVGEGGFPQVFNEIFPSKDIGDPPKGDPLAAALAGTVEASTVKVFGQACGRVQEGSGWTVAKDLVVTNAHVVAGEPQGATDVMLPNGQSRPAKVVLYNPDVDLALLSVPNLGEAPLKVATGAAGQKGAVFGHPNGQDPIAVQPAAIAEEVTAVGQDLYHRHNTSRDVFALAAVLFHGDSGAPLVNTAGQVVGIAFAIAPDRPTTAYALSTSELKPLLHQARDKVISTQGCVDG